MTPAIRRQRSTSDEVTAGHPSQGRCLLKNPITNVPVERSLRANVNPGSEQLLKVLHKADVVERSAAWFPLDQQVNVARLRCVTTNDRTKDTNVAGSVPFGQPKDLTPPFAAQGFQAHHASILRQLVTQVHMMCRGPSQIAFSLRRCGRLGRRG